MEDEIRTLTRRLRRARLWAILAPFVVSCVGCPLFLTVSELRYGNGFIGWGWLFFAVLASAPMLVPVAIAAARSVRAGFYGAFWPSLGGILGALPLTLRYATVNLASDAQAGLALIWGPYLSVKWAALGAAVGLALTFVRPFRFRLACERRLDVLRCRVCRYSFAGLESAVCPECGAVRG